jgi:hypothetical protein
MISNRQRLNYVLDTLAESFPDDMILKSCNCGADGGKQPQVATGQMTKRKLIEEALLEALGGASAAGAASGPRTLTAVLDGMSEAELAKLLSHLPVAAIDQQLNDLAVFLSRPTTLDEIITWDKLYFPAASGSGPVGRTQSSS